MNTLHRVSAGVLTLAMMTQPVSAAAGYAGELRFSEPVEVTGSSTPGDILKQSDNYKDGVLTVEGHEFVIDENGHAVLKQPDEGWLCSWFGWWCPELTVGEITVDQAKAKDRVVAQVVSSVHAEMVKDTGRVLPLLAFAYPEPLAAGTVVYQARKGAIPMNIINDSWFFFLDLEPGAFFDHRAEFVLVDVKTGEITRNRVFTAPRIKGTIRYMDLNERWTTPDRCYPADLKDMPRAGDWPLAVEADFREDESPAMPPPDRKVPPAPAGSPASLYEVPWLIPVAEAATVPGPAANPADPCAGKPRRKVAVTISGEGPNTTHDDGLVDGETIANSEQNMVNLLGEMGVPYNDIHRFNPENTPKLKDVFAEIRRVTKDLGPCDKFFFYIFGHGTITDEDGNHIPDKPSRSIVYGHGDDEEVMGKGRWSEHSLITLLEDIKAQDINIVIESCFSGSIRDWIAMDTGNPADGSAWHIFLAAGGLRPSYGHGAYDGKPAGAYYTDAYTACASKKLAERGYVNPTIEQIEEVMRECQKEFNENPTEDIRAPLVEDVTRVTYTISPSVSITEGNSGVKYAEFTVTRSPVQDTAVSFDYKTYDNNPEGDVSNYANPADYKWNKEGSDVTFEPGQATATVRIAINGDTDVEEDETFGVWFPTLDDIRSVTIVDDDKPVTTASSSSAGTALASSSSSAYSVTVTIDAKDWKIGGLNAGGYYVVDMGDGVTVSPDKPVTITIKIPDEEVKIGGGITVELDAKCPTCEELAEQAMLQADICAMFEQDLADAQAEAADVDRQIASGDKDVKAAQDALNAFNNPKSSASSNGRTVDSSDLRAGREWAAGLWAQYRAGDLTAQQLEQKWKDGMTDAERQKIKDDIRARLEADVAAAKARVEKLKADRAALAAEIAGLQADLDACNKEFDRLIDAWMDCEDSCVETDATIGVMTGGGSGGSAASQAASSSKSVPPASSSSSSKSSSSSSHRDVFQSSSSSKPVTTPSSKSSSSSSRTATQPASSKSSSSAGTALCPNGTTPNRYECEEFCGHENGTCVQEDGCWSCTVAQCPAGTYTNTCPSSCTSGCDVVGQDGATQCLKCKQSCAEVCAGMDAQVGTNWNAYISSQLNQYVCVSGATVEIETTTAGSCTCSTQPTVQIDSTPPVCKGTPCGDVVCGGSASCQQGESTVTVNCNWGGWQNVGENQFKPIIGQ